MIPTSRWGRSDIRAPGATHLREAGSRLGSVCFRSALERVILEMEDNISFFMLLSNQEHSNPIGYRSIDTAGMLTMWSLVCADDNLVFIRVLGHSNQYSFKTLNQGIVAMKHLHQWHDYVHLDARDV